MNVLIIILCLLFNPEWSSFGSSPPQIETELMSNVMHHKIVMIKIEIGECKECNRSLEKQLMKLNGMESVEFIKKSKTLKIVYNPMYISETDIHHKIAEHGYDTKLVKATNQAYNDLLECCKYRN
jgi:copper chaperone CopZ